MPDALRALVLAVRFALELALLAALAYAGWQVGGPIVARVALAIALAAAAAAVWGLVVSPKARVRVHEGVRLGVELVLFAAGAAALALAGERELALGLFALAALWSALARL